MFTTKAMTRDSLLCIAGESKTKNSRSKVVYPAHSALPSLQCGVMSARDPIVTNVGILCPTMSMLVRMMCGRIDVQSMPSTLFIILWRVCMYISTLGEVSLKDFLSEIEKA